MVDTFRDNVIVTVDASGGAPGTGPVKWLAAVTDATNGDALTPDAAGAAATGETHSMLWQDGNAMSLEEGCAYTASTKTWTRGTVKWSTTGSQLSLSNSAKGTIVMPSDQSGLRLIGYTEFTSNGTWTKDPRTKRVEITCIAGGGGGGSGAREPTTSNRSGGAGGGVLSPTDGWFLASDLPSSCTVTVGAGGAGGTSVTTDSSAGHAGSAGGDTIVSASGVVLVSASGGSAGSGGSNLTQSLGLNSSGPTFQAQWAFSGTGSGKNTTGGAAVGGCRSAGGGGGGAGAAASSTTTAAGGAGAPANTYTFENQSAGGGAAGGTSGGAGVTPSDASSPAFGGGGGGGSYATGQATGAGGNGAAPGGGGGGGAGSDNGFASGAGGNGARGAVRIWEYA